MSHNMTMRCNNKMQRDKTTMWLQPLKTNATTRLDNKPQQQPKMTRYNDNCNNKPQNQDMTTSNNNEQRQ